MTYVKFLLESIHSQSTNESIDMKETIRFILNGERTIISVEGDRKLLWVLRTDFGLTGTKYGCGRGLCGSCTVLVNKEAVRSCQISIREVADKEVLTIEGLAQGDKLHPLQDAFLKYGAVQCGFCTPGMIMNAFALLLKNPKLSREQIIAGMEPNLCRCSAYKRIIQAIESVSARG
jgi:aerobic-type carbon monoxide dehydrogenase small subunit (CoxS/CutS family)